LQEIKLSSEKVLKDKIFWSGIMRKYAFLKEIKNNICKVMIFESTGETFVFLYNSIDDTPCIADYWFDNLEEADEYCNDLGISNEDWLFIDDPLEECPHDLISCK
jgi:hypothetical protein